jgi:hypothetical protein
MTHVQQIIANLMRVIAQRQAQHQQEQDPVLKQQLQHTVQQGIELLQEFNTAYNAGHKPN